MTMLADALDQFAKDLKKKEASELTLILKYHQVICKEVIDKLENFIYKIS